MSSVSWKMSVVFAGLTLTVMSVCTLARLTPATGAVNENEAAELR